MTVWDAVFGYEWYSSLFGVFASSVHLLEGVVSGSCSLSFHPLIDTLNFMSIRGSSSSSIWSQSCTISVTLCELPVNSVHIDRRWCDLPRFLGEGEGNRVGSPGSCRMGCWIYCRTKVHFVVGYTLYRSCFPTALVRVSWVIRTVFIQFTYVWWHWGKRTGGSGLQFLLGRKWTIPDGLYPYDTWGGLSIKTGLYSSCFVGSCWSSDCSSYCSLPSPTTSTESLIDSDDLEFPMKTILELGVCASFSVAHDKFQKFNVPLEIRYVLGLDRLVIDFLCFFRENELHSHAFLLSFSFICISVCPDV